MSPFNFETFGAGHIPPFPRFVFDIKDGKYKFQPILSDDIEDVEYVDASNPQPEPSEKDRKSLSYDKEERNDEIFEYSLKKAKEFKKNDPYFELSFGVLFSIGAHWADDNPISKFHNFSERAKAFSEEVEKIQKEMESNYGEELPLLHIFTISTTTLGFRWADKNPPKYY